MTTSGGHRSTPGTDGQAVRCSFCKKGSQEVAELIAGPAGLGCAPAYICEGCIELCAYMLEQKRTWGGDSPAPDQSDMNTQKVLSEKIDQALSILDHLESEVIKLRHGLSDAYTYTVDEIAEQFGIKPERVAEIEKRSIDKLRTRTMTPDQ